jgi:hypothetical protein
MSERYLLNANYVAPEAAKARGSVERADLLAGVLSALHPAALVERHVVYPLLGGIVNVRVWLLLAGQGEADDSADRVRNAPGMPPVDAVEVRHLGTV